MVVQKGLPRWLLGGLSLALALPLAVYATVGSFARYTADDYCWAGVLHTEGFWQAQVQWYTVYSPRYAFTFVVNVVELAGTSIVPVLPALAIIVSLCALTWTLNQFGMKAMAAVALAETATLATLQTAPDLPQSLYWQTGMLTYLLPLVLATLLVGLIRGGTRRGQLTLARLAVCAAVTFVAGGLSETYLIPQNVALTLAVVTCAALAGSGRAPRVLPAYLAAALAGGVLALLAIVVAPATAIRVGGTPADLWLALSASIATAAYQLVRLGRYFPFTVLLCVAVPAVLSGRSSPVSRHVLFLTTVGVAVTLPFCYFPSFYAQNGNPPARSLIVPGAILIGYLFFGGYALGGLLNSPRRQPPLGPPARWPLIATVLLAVLVPLGVAAFSLPDVGAAAQHAAIWDTEDQHIRAARDAGLADLSVPPVPPYLGENFVTTDSTDWFNRCVARYYGVRSIATTS